MSANRPEVACRTMEAMSAFHPLQTLASSAKLVPMDNDNPAKRDVGARIRVRTEYADAAAAAFEREGLTPIYVEHRADGDVSFWFGKLGDADLLRACEAIPREWYALTGNIRQVSFPLIVDASGRRAFSLRWPGDRC